MYDVAKMETSLEATRHDLAAKLAEGRTVIAGLMDRHTAMGRRIEDAVAALQQIEQQLEATNTVIRLLDDRGLMLRSEPMTEPCPPAAIAPISAEPLKSEPFKAVAYFRCVTEGHDMVVSRSVPGFNTCRRCRHRRRI